MIKLVVALSSLTFLTTLTTSFGDNIYFYINDLPTISLNGSNVPNVDYEINAISCLTEAYVLYPNNTNSRLQAYSQLFHEKYSANEWSVAEQCTILYFPKTPFYVDLNVIDKTSNMVVRIFSSSGTNNITTTVPTKKP